jgi:transposase
MGGTMQQTTANTSSSVTEPWKEAQPALKQSLRQGQMLQRQWGHLTPMERQAIGGQRQNANFAKSYMPAQQDLISQLYAGGGYGEGDQDVRDAMQANRQMLTPYMQSNYLDPMSNPYLQPAIEQARRGAYTDVSDKFASAGRNFSGALADAASRGMTGAALPMLLGQYNTNVGAQQAAGQQAMGAATAGQEALNKSQQSRLQAQMAAPQQIQNLNIPQNMMLEAEARRRNIPLDVLARTTSMFTGMGQLGGTSAGTGFGTQQTTPNPFMQYGGMGLGLLGMGMRF